MVSPTYGTNAVDWESGSTSTGCAASGSPGSRPSSSARTSARC